MEKKAVGCAHLGSLARLNTVEGSPNFTQVSCLSCLRSTLQGIVSFQFYQLLRNTDGTLIPDGISKRTEARSSTFTTQTPC